MRKLYLLAIVWCLLVGSAAAAGLYALGSLDQTTGFKLNASVPNLSIRISWANTETSPGLYDFGAIDAGLAAAAGAGGKVSLRILGFSAYRPEKDHSKHL